MRRRNVAVAAAVIAVAVSAALPEAAKAGGWTPPQPTYQLNDAAAGDALSILPPGENGLVNAADLLLYEGNRTRPSGSQDQLAAYQDLQYNAQGLTDSQLSTYYDDESFGIPDGGITRTETPSSSVNVVVYRDQHDVPHIYGDNQVDVAFGAGYAAAEDRLFEMDVLRHYGAGDLSSFLGPSCADEQMDHDSLLLGGYTTAQKQAQLDALPVQYGALGQTLLDMVNNYVAGINAYISATTTDPGLLPADYAAALGPPQPWAATDIIDIATLVGGIFGRGGGDEMANAELLQYLDSKLSSAQAGAVFADLKGQNDPGAFTTAAAAFPYEIPGTVNPSTIAMPDNAAAPLTGGPTDTTSNCSLTPPSLPGLAVLKAFLSLNHTMSNALLVDASHSVDGHPIAVMGPQVGYYAPEILMEEDLHATDGSYDVEGTAFPGTNFLVELGRGRTFAWSATSAETDNVDQRLEIICDPNGGAPAANGTFYLINGQCVPMREQTFSETAVPKPGGQGGPVTITHNIYYTNAADPIQGVVQGWTTADGGHSVALVNQRSTYQHEVDSGIGFLRFGMPSQTYDATSWMQGAGDIQYTFNWFYIDTGTIAYYQSGRLPIRPSDVDPNLPTWGDGRSEWQGFLSFADHVHQIGSPSGYILSWNNKPAPQFSAADSMYAWGPLQRVNMLQQQVELQLAAHPGGITRANLVTAMETGGSVDVDGATLVPSLLQVTAGRSEPPGVQAMLAQLQQWLNDGTPRRKANAGDAQYEDAAADVIMDSLVPAMTRSFFDHIFSAGGLYQRDGEDAGYTVMPMGFAQEPNDNDAHDGTSYFDGWRGYDWKVLQDVLGNSINDDLSSDTKGLLCGGAGVGGCGTALDTALLTVYNQLVSANSGSNVSAWTQDAQTKSTGDTLPVYDDIQFTAVGVVGQPAIDWQNRPTFQQVVEFPAALPASQTPEAPVAPLLPLAAAVAAVIAGRRCVAHHRTHPRTEV